MQRDRALAGQFLELLGRPGTNFRSRLQEANAAAGRVGAEVANLERDSTCSRVAPLSIALEAALALASEGQDKHCIDVGT